MLSQGGSSEPQAAAPTSVEQIRRVSLANARAAWVNGNAVFLDVRSEQDYERGHIPGAVSIPLEELTARMNELNPEDWIITYCT